MSGVNEPLIVARETRLFPLTGRERAWRSFSILNTLRWDKVDRSYLTKDKAR